MATPSAPITILVEQMHPRACYGLETVLGAFLGFELQILLSDDDTGIRAAQALGRPVLSYGGINHDGIPALACNGLLYEDHIRPSQAVIDWYGEIASHLRTEDHIARIFFHLTQYALLQPGARPVLDVHGRYPDGDGELVVHDELLALGEVLRPHLRQLPQPRAWDYEVTIDVDQPWKYLHKPWHVQWGGFLRDRLRGLDTSERWQALRYGRDPFDVMETVRKLCPAAKTQLFFLVGGEHPNDSRFKIGIKAYQQQVLDWKAAGFGVGVHPSYESSSEERLISIEKQALEKVVGSISSSRQHFLRYRTPQTFRALIAAGIRRDYSLCRSSGPGAATGVALPYRWFDLQRNQATDLVLVPALAMDRSLQQYLRLDPEAAQRALEEWLARSRAVRGHFVLILHNETFSDSGEWTGWLDMLTRFLPQLEA